MQTLAINCNWRAVAVPHDINFIEFRLVRYYISLYDKLLQSIIVRTKEHHFQVIAGSRRYLACKSLGWKKIACHVVELDDIQTFEVSLIENIQKKINYPL